ncbi:MULTISPECIES: hypothetical protein [unclassified Dysgonomonas]|nr:MULTISPECIES: hypothetical protein [unclassified Dysgonomonas]
MQYILISLVFFMVSCNQPKDNTLDNNRPEITTVEGLAKMAKRGPILVTEKDEIYYIKDFDYWNDSIIGKKIRVEAILTIKKDSTENENIIVQSMGNSEINYLKIIEYTILK